MAAFGADDKFFKAQAQAAAREAQQRWPLFRTLAVEPRAEPPPLTEQEKTELQSLPAVDVSQPKQTLKRPVVQDKLAQGLVHLIRQVNSEVQGIASAREAMVQRGLHKARQTTAATLPQRRAAPAAAGVPPASQHPLQAEQVQPAKAETLDQPRGPKPSLFGAVAARKDVEPVNDVGHDRMQSEVSPAGGTPAAQTGLLSSIFGKVQAEPPVGPAPTPDDSLAGLFGRLEKSPKHSLPEETPAPSFGLRSRLRLR